MSGVNYGLYSINKHLIQPVLPSAQSATILNTLYNFNQQAESTPLRAGLKSVGQYLDDDRDASGKTLTTGNIGDSPYATAANGGECQQAFCIAMTDGYDNGAAPGYTNVDGTKGVPYADTYSDSMADTAMYFWSKDLSSTLANMLPTSSADTANWQHMVTYTVSFGVTGSLNPNDYDENLKKQDIPV